MRTPFWRARADGKWTESGPVCHFGCVRVMIITYTFFNLSTTTVRLHNSVKPFFPPPRSEGSNFPVLFFS